MPCPRWPFVASTVSERLASAASNGGSAPCACRARFRAAFRWLLLQAPAAQIASGFDRFRGRSALTASTVSRPSMLGRTPGARRRAARRKASEEQESEKRREEKEKTREERRFGPPRGWRAGTGPRESRAQGVL